MVAEFGNCSSKLAHSNSHASVARSSSAFLSATNIRTDSTTRRYRSRSRMILSGSRTGIPTSHVFVSVS
jgi:hypothetical protein